MTKAVLLTLVALGSLAARGAERVVRFAATDAALVNPGQGWLSSKRFPSSVRYLRFDWVKAEPAEGALELRWMDEAIEQAAKEGKRVAFRVMTANAHSSGYYCSPKWLFDAGCKFHEYDVDGRDPTSGGKAMRRVEPDYGDPIFLAKHRAFVMALGKKYDGHAGVEFLDIGSYGIWGEWHTKHPVPWEVRKQIIDMYLDAFKRTPMVCMSDDAEALAYCIARGAGYRRDGVGSDWHERTWIGSKKYAKVEGFAEQWKKAPVVFEWFGTYDYIKGRGWSFDKAVEFMLKNHVTFINDNVGRVPAEEMAKLERLSRLAGYRFVLGEAAYAPAVKRGEALAVRMGWENVGVGKLYREHPVVLYLLDEKGAVVAEQRQAGVDAREWLPGRHEVVGRLEVGKGVAAGTYTLAVALVDGQTGKAAIALGCDAKEVGRVYRIGEVGVE